MIRLENVSKRYGNGHYGVIDVNLEIHRGEFLFLVGPSGAGKSSLIRMLYREELPTSGEIYLDEFRLSQLRRTQVSRLRRQLGVVFQDVKLCSVAPITLSQRPCGWRRTSGTAISRVPARYCPVRLCGSAMTACGVPWETICPP